MRRTPIGASASALLTRLRVLLLLGLFGCMTGGTLEDRLLDAILGTTTDAAFNNALEKHGPVRDDEIPALADAAEAWSVRKRRNAVRLLALSANPEAAQILRERVETTHDLLEWAYAMRALLDGPTAAEVCRLRPEMIERGLQAEEPLVRGIALEAGVQSGRPEPIETVRASLSDPSWEVRQAAVQALEPLGPTRLEPELRQLLHDETDERVIPWLLRLLATSTNPQTAQVLREGYLATEPMKNQAWLTAFNVSDAPWIREMFLEVARTANPHRTDALNYLIKHTDQRDPALLQICIEIFENTPEERGSKEWHRYQTWRQRCQGLANDLAGEIVPPDEVEDRLRAHLAALEQ